ncbi:hypothetical protein ABT246_17790 [Streptomyces sp. NPDC001553]|uniref:hypothetical protein n=1 Tax=Streptomyces sp. NPDC001553 TaxID=3154385 RepID=UPI003326D78B
MAAVRADRYAEIAIRAHELNAALGPYLDTLTLPVRSLVRSLVASDADLDGEAMTWNRCAIPSPL